MYKVHYIELTVLKCAVQQLNIYNELYNSYILHVPVVPTNTL